MLLQAGSFEMLLSDTLSVAEKAREAGVRRRVSVYEGMFHVFQMSMDPVSYTHLDVYKRQAHAWIGSHRKTAGTHGYG